MGSSAARAARSASEPGRSWRSISREERLRVGLTQAELASRAGLAVNTVRKYENGGRMPSRGALERILHALLVTIATTRAAILDRGFSYPDVRYPPDTTPLGDIAALSSRSPLPPKAEVGRVVAWAPG